MQVSATTGKRQNKAERQSRHGYTFAKVLDGRKQPIRGLWSRNSRYYGRLSVEDGNSGLKSVQRVPLMNADEDPVGTVPQALAALNKLRTQRADDVLPVLGLTPTFAQYADEYLKTVKDTQGKKDSTIDKEETIIDLWKKHLGGIRLDKIRPVHVAGMVTKRLADGLSKRTAKLDIIVLRNVLKHARDVDELIRELPVPPGLNLKLKSEAPKRELFTPEELEQLCAAAMATSDDGKQVTKNGQQRELQSLVASRFAGR